MHFFYFIGGFFTTLHGKTLIFNVFFIIFFYLFLTIVTVYVRLEIGFIQDKKIISKVLSWNILSLRNCCHIRFLHTVTSGYKIKNNNKTKQVTFVDSIRLFCGIFNQNIFWNYNSKFLLDTVRYFNFLALFISFKNF